MPTNDHARERDSVLEVRGRRELRTPGDVHGDRGRRGNDAVHGAHVHDGYQVNNDPHARGNGVPDGHPESHGAHGQDGYLDRRSNGDLHGRRDRRDGEGDQGRRAHQGRRGGRGRRGGGLRRWGAASLAIGVLIVSAGCSVVDEAPVSQPVPATGPAGEISGPNADTTFIAECTADSRVRRPDAYVLACADGNEFLEQLTWSDWGEPRATATGTLVYNDCSPTCAAGKDVEVPATVVVDQLVADEDIATYRRLTVTSGPASGSSESTQQVFHLPAPEPGEGAAITLPSLAGEPEADGTGEGR